MHFMMSAVRLGRLRTTSFPRCVASWLSVVEHGSISSVILYRTAFNRLCNQWRMRTCVSILAAASAAVVALSSKALPLSEIEPSIAGNRMVEVEKKIFLNSKQRNTLEDRLESVSYKTFWDTYYDRIGCTLTSKDWWLRQRDGAWELKIPFSKSEGLCAIESYEEIIEPLEILARLQESGFASKDAVCDVSVTPTKRLENMLVRDGFSPFARLQTHRISLKADAVLSSSLGVQAIHVDLDSVSFDSSFAESGVSQVRLDAGVSAPFLIAEVEVMTTPSVESVARAKHAVDKFLALHNLHDAPKAYSKLVEYLLRFRPRHLEALSVAGVVPAEKLAKLKAVAAIKILES